jgi:hypothetical protein
MPLNDIVSALNLLEDLIELDTGKIEFNRAKTYSNIMLYQV